MQAALRSKEKSTLKSYFTYFKKWHAYAIDRRFCPLPADPLEVGGFLVDGVDVMSHQALKLLSSAINFFHKLFGFPSPCSTLLDGLVNEYVAKHSKKPKCFREPILISHLEAIFNLFCFKTCSLFFLRNLGILVVAFFGFLRYSELAKLKLSDIVFSADKVLLRLRNSKTDRLREGQHVVFDVDSFPARFLKLYFRRFNFNEFCMHGKDCFVFMTMKRNAGQECFVYRQRKMSYASFGRAMI